MAELKIGETMIKPNIALALKLMSTGTAKVEGEEDKVVCLCHFCNKESTYLKEDWINDSITECIQCKKLRNKGMAVHKRLKLRSNEQIGSLALEKIVSSVNKVEAVMKCSNCRREVSVSLVDIEKEVNAYAKDNNIQGEETGGKLSNNQIHSILKNLQFCDCMRMDKLKEDIGLIHSVNKSDMPRFRPKANREIKGWLYLGGKVIGAKTTLQVYQCQSCFTTKMLRDKELYTFDGKCERCEELKQSQSIPLTQMDWVGYTSNCMRVQKIYMKDGIKMASVQCLICGSTEEIALSTFITDSSLLCSKCGTNKIILRCPICNQPHINTTLKALYSNSLNQTVIKCSNTGEEIDKEDLVCEHEFKLEMAYIKSRYKNIYKFNHRIKGDNNKASLIVFEEGYTGTDGKSYNNCMCTKHNKFLNLTNEEAENYQHEFCIDLRMVAYNIKGKLK